MTIITEITTRVWRGNHRFFHLGVVRNLSSSGDTPHHQAASNMTAKSMQLTDTLAPTGQQPSGCLFMRGGKTVGRESEAITPLTRQCLFQFQSLLRHNNTMMGYQKN